MQRRNFLGWGASSLAAAACGMTQAATARAEGDSWSDAFGRASGAAMWPLAYMNGEERTDAPASVRGRFPDAVRGTFFRNGPAVHALGGRRYHHFFDGDGMIQRYTIGEASVVHDAKLVRTAKLMEERQAGRRLYPGFGTEWSDLPGVANPDSFNAANTNVLHLNGELLALWEGGSAYTLDARTLNTSGPKTWSKETRGAPFSAHPRRDPDGTLWNFGVNPVSDTLILYEINPSGSLRRAQAIPMPYTSYMHDFAVTKRSLVFIVPPLILDHERLAQRHSYLDSHVWKAAEGMKVLVVDKQDWSKQVWFELPSAFFFHIANAWEDGDGVIHVDYIHANSPHALMNTNRDLMRGTLNHRPAYSIASAVLQRERRKATQQLLAIDAEFPRIDERFATAPYRHVIHATQAGDAHPGFSGVARTLVDTGRTQSYSYGEDHMVEEHLFVPASASAPEGAGWIVGTAANLRTRQTLLSCFDAERLDAGPVAQATLPYMMPLGLHGTFVKV